MAIIAYPDPNYHTQIGLMPVNPAFVNRSQLTGARQAVDAGYGWWEATITVANMRAEDARQWLLFFGRARGPVNSFRVPITAREQHSASYVVRANGAGSGYSLATDGWPVSATPLLAGDLVTIGDQLLRLDADVITNASGQATIQFHAPLRGSVADNTLVETRNPWLLASLPENSPMLSIALADIQPGFSFDVMESY